VSKKQILDKPIVVKSTDAEKKVLRKKAGDLGLFSVTGPTHGQPCVSSMVRVSLKGAKHFQKVRVISWGSLGCSLKSNRATIEGIHLLGNPVLGGMFKERLPHDPSLIGKSIIVNFIDQSTAILIHVHDE